MPIIKLRGFGAAILCVAAADQALHQRIAEKYPVFSRGVDKSLSIFLALVSNTRFGIILALVLVPLMASGAISFINAGCIGGVWLIVLAWIAKSDLIKNFPIPSRFFLIIILGIGLALGGIKLAHWSTRQWLVHNAVPVRPPPNDPNIEIRFDMFGSELPIIILPKTTAYILIMSQDQTFRTLYAQNSESVDLKWPTEKKLWPPESIGVWWLSNHGDKSIFNLRTKVTIHFEVPKPESGFTVLSTASRAVALPVLRPTESIPIYFVNESDMEIEIDIPENASVEVQGETQARSIKFRRYGILPWNASPSLYVWNNFQQIGNLRKK